jgi:DNA repair ATPase RecN
MPQISTDTLIVAIQAVAAQARELRDAVRRGDADPEEMELLAQWQDAARDLERAYDVEAQVVLNLPPYDELIGEG